MKPPPRPSGFTNKQQEGQRVFGVCVLFWFVFFKYNSTHHPPPPLAPLTATIQKSEESFKKNPNKPNNYIHWFQGGLTMCKAHARTCVISNKKVLYLSLWGISFTLTLKKNYICFLSLFLHPHPPTPPLTHTHNQIT